MSAKNPLYQLLDQGQSVWLDSIQRGQIKSGELKKLTETMALRGETANPSIFEKAIISSNDYDADIQKLSEAGESPEAIYENLATDDVRSACDVFLPIYKDSNGEDGFVSIEVSPRIAYQTQPSIDEAKRFWRIIDRPNLMVKIPGTKEGVPAIEECLHQGLNINITLLFAVEAYEDVAYAYIRALERRVAEGKAIDRIASVASFFVSRIDTLADQWLTKAGNSDLPGKVAIANAQIAYEHFQKIFSSDRWNALLKKDARVQRPLWASTSTKNPKYRDVMYVEDLIGPHTINTLPLETIKAFADHGVVARTIDSDFGKAHGIIERFESAGFSLRAVTNQVLKEGVEKFDDAFAKLLQGIEKKVKHITTTK